VAAAASVVTAGLAVGCGGGADEPPTTITEEDLPMMVLQREDVPAGLNLLEEDGERQGFVEPLYDPLATAMFLRVFERPRAEAEPGSVVCIINSALLYESPEDAKRTYRELEELGRVFEEAAREQGQESWGEKVSLPELGDERKGFRTFDQSATFCSSYEDEPAEEHMVVFLRRNVATLLLTYTYEQGASFDETIELAQTQANRIEAIFEGDDS
jgi:hypothetical protein